MNSKTLPFINGVLIVISLFLAYQIYSVIMEPIEFEKIKFRRFCAVTERLEQIREAQLTYKSEMGNFAGDMNALVAFIDTGKITIVERKDSSFMRFNKQFQMDMNKDTVIVRVLGSQPAKDKFGPGFDANILRKVPYNDAASFEMGADKIERSGVVIPVFEVSVAETTMLEDLKDKYKQFINKETYYTIGSLTEAKISGNYENIACKERNN